MSHLTSHLPSNFNPEDIGLRPITVDADISAVFEGHRLSSAFQPIFSLTLQRAVGYEALLRARDVADLYVSPPQLFAGLSPERQNDLDSLSHLLHLNSYRRLSKDGEWIFLNMTPEVFLGARQAKSGMSFGDTLAALRILPHCVVIELLEKDVRDSAEFEKAVAYFRELGCLIALDDFGAGSSNFDRVWSLRPKIVKLDRNLIHRASRTTRVRRILPQLISLLHEAGAMVLVEGVETDEEAYLALDANADFAQGYLFGRPAPTLSDPEETRDVMRSIWRSFDEHWNEDGRRQKNALAPYVNAIGNASVLLSAHRSMAAACAAFLELPEATICYLLDERGQQIGGNRWGQGFAAFPDPRLAPLRDTHNARWSRCPYFRRAIENFGKVQITRPYFSISSARLCVTVSVCFLQGDEIRVICGDVNWNPELMLRSNKKGDEECLKAI